MILRVTQVLMIIHSWHTVVYSYYPHKNEIGENNRMAHPFTKADGVILVKIFRCNPQKVPHLNPPSPCPKSRHLDPRWNGIRLTIQVLQFWQRQEYCLRSRDQERRILHVQSTQRHLRKSILVHWKCVHKCETYWLKIGSQ